LNVSVNRYTVVPPSLSLDFFSAAFSGLLRSIDAKERIAPWAEQLVLFVPSFGVLSHRRRRFFGMKVLGSVGASSSPVRLFS